MKLSSVAVLFGAAVAAFFPGASADSVSLRGTTTDEESFIDMINCSRKTTCEYDYGTCLIIDAQCQGFCVWVGTAQNGSCVRGSGGNRSCRSNINSITCRNDGCVWSNNACRNPSSPSIFKCSNYNRTSNKNCVSKGCVWDGNTRTCNANIITRSCRSIPDSSTCRGNGCVWSNNACRNPSSPSIFKCSDYNRTNRNKCVNKGCFWDGNTRTCNANIITRSCRSIPDSSTCRSNGCVWSNNACRNPSSPSIFKCSDYNRTNRNKCVNKGCFWDSETRTCNANIITRSCRSLTIGSDCFSAGCDWINGVCRNPSSPSIFKCSDYDRTNSNTCVGNGCFWDSMTSTCNANIINRSNPTPSRSGDSNCTGPNSNQCKFMTEFCYTKGDCSANASGKCQVKPRTYADCANSGKFNTYPTSAGNACGSNHFYASECAAAQEGKNIPFPNKDEVAEEVEREESDSVFEEE